MIQTWSEEQERREAAVKRIGRILSKIAERDDTMHLLTVIEGAVGRLEDGRPFEAVWLLHEYAGGFDKAYTRGVK